LIVSKSPRSAGSSLGCSGATGAPFRVRAGSAATVGRRSQPRPWLRCLGTCAQITREAGKWTRPSGREIRRRPSPISTAGACRIAGCELGMDGASTFSDRGHRPGSRGEPPGAHGHDLGKDGQRDLCGLVGTAARLDEFSPRRKSVPP
jgi:hypothetical protein